MPASESAAQDLALANVRSFQISMTRNAEAIENHPGSVRTVQRVEMNSGNIVINEVMALLQGVLNASAPDHLRIILTGLQST
jgi:hypothetical protein